MDIFWLEGWDKLDWKQCLIKNVKSISVDIELIKSLKKTSENKIISSKELSLRTETMGSKISLSYDSVRELLEALAISKGFKIYEHICYTAFLKEIVKHSSLADEFDELRKIRNDINYYGKDVSLEEAKVVLDRLDKLLKEVKILLEWGWKTNLISPSK
mgnify:CR=1 FL=1